MKDVNNKKIIILSKHLKLQVLRSLSLGEEYKNWNMSGFLETQQNFHMTANPESSYFGNGKGL
jgi:hypothetical protein